MKMKSVLSLLLLCAVLNSGHAQNLFHAIGPEGIDAMAIYVFPNTQDSILVGAPYAVYVVYPDTKEMFSFHPLPASYITEIVRDPLLKNRFYCGSDLGLLVSNDGGMNWKYLFRTRNGLLWAIAINPFDSSELYVGFYRSSGGVFGNPGIYKSTDGGSTWKAINNGLTNLDITDIKVNPANPSIVYAATYGGGIFKTTSKGKLGWSCLSDSLREKHIVQMEFSNINPNIIYVGTRTGIFKSMDGGKSWLDINSVIFKDLFVHSLLVSPTGDTLLIGTDNGLYRSSDAGGQWTEVDANLDIKATKTIAGGYAEKVFCGTPEGIYRSEDWGNTWTKVPVKIRAIAVNDVAFDTTVTPTGILLGTDGAGIYLSTNEGRAWDHLKISEGFNRVINCVVSDSTIVANLSISDSSRRIRNRLYKKMRWEDYWNDISINLPENDFVSSVAINPKDEKMLFAGSYHSLIYKSIDGGLTWEQKSRGISNGELYFTILKIFTGNPNIIFASTIYRNEGYSAFYRSDDGGESWKPHYAGLPVHFLARNLVINPRTADSLYLAMGYDLIYSSFNGGLTWHLSNTGIAPGAIVNGAASPNSSTLLETCTSSRALFDELTTTYLSNQNEPLKKIYKTKEDTVEKAVSSITINLKRPNILYTWVDQIHDIARQETHSSYIYRSTDGGLTWQKIMRAPDWQYHPKIHLDPNNPNKLYVFNATGLYSYDLTQLSVQTKNRKNIPKKYRLFQNYPNPFNPTTIIRYRLPEAAHVTLAIYNLQGRLVETLVNGEKEAGSYSVQWHAESLPSGVYFYQIQTGQFTATKKLLLLK